MPPNDSERSLTESLTSRVSWADAVLLSIPLVFLAAAPLVVVPTVSLTESVTFSTGAALLVTGYALFAGAPKN